jgi:hypothetical protein
MAAALVALTAGLGRADAVARDPLRGHWDTGKLAMRDVRAAVIAAGYTNAEFDGFLRRIGRRNATAWETNLVFYRVVRENDAPYVKITGWDPTRSSMPRDGDHGPYRLLAGGRVAITSADPDENHYRDTYAYRVVGRTLSLRPVSHADPTRTKAVLRLEKILLYVVAAAPFRRTS